MYMSAPNNHCDGSGLTGVILAAGKGMRAYPSTRYIPKVLMEVEGKSLIERNVEILRDQLGVTDILVIIGYLGEQVIEYFERRPPGVRLRYVTQKEQKGIGHALLQVEAELAGRRFVVILGDELYLGQDHRKLLGFLDTDADAVLTFKREQNPKVVSRNFVGSFDGDRVLSLEEKPQQPHSDLMGLGTYLLTDRVFHYLKTTGKSTLRNEVEITDALSAMAQSEKVYRCVLDVEYTNITTREDCNLANYAVRNANFDGYKVSVVIPAYNEAETISRVVEDFIHHPHVDEVLVVDNNSKDDTAALARAAGARVIREENQGYGCALRRGLDEAAGDLMVMTEADGSFRAKDLSKILEYLKDCDMAIGTRTTRQMIEQGANMDGPTRWANIFFGKFLELLWWNQEPRFTDVGCTYRGIWKRAWQDIRGITEDHGPGFSTEMMLSMLMQRKRIIEIPVTYYKRQGGQSAHSVDYRAKTRTALKMLRVTLKQRFLANRTVA